MTERIIDMPDDCLYEWQDVYYPDERDDPMAVREEIVRCRDCVHYKPYRTHQHGMMNRCHDEHGHTHKRDETDFCSRGERRTNDN